MPGVREVRRALAGGEMPTLPVPGRLYDTWRSSYNRSTSHVELVTSAAQVSEGVMTWQPVVNPGPSQILVKVSLLIHFLWRDL
ncbi:hypothetical protein BHE74_00017747 [Ensete ventricosum]|nr:hypothetical protein BHE74_00017747 [Ensete ventricosum]